MNWIIIYTTMVVCTLLFIITTSVVLLEVWDWFTHLPLLDDFFDSMGNEIDL